MNVTEAAVLPTVKDAAAQRHEQIETMSVDIQDDTGKAEGEIIDHGAETTLHRSLGTRHLTMVSLGSAIGMGMWLGSGTSLVDGGPASLFIGYLISSSMVWSVSQSIGEMAVMYPLPSAFVQWSTIFVSPAAGFALGWGYWFSYWITIANELQVLPTLPFGSIILGLSVLSNPGHHNYPQLLDR